MVDDPYLERLRAANKSRSKIAKLRAVYDRHPDTPEGKSALRKALALEKQLDQTVEEPKLSKPQPNVPNDSYFGAFANAFKHRFPGVDNEDYSKYARKDDDEDSDRNS
jgi:hypothetical protein